MLESIREIIEKELELRLENLTVNDKLVDRGLDSITFMMLVIYIEERYEIEFNFDGIFMQQFIEVTFGDLITEIERLLQAKEKNCG